MISYNGFKGVLVDGKRAVTRKSRDWVEKAVAYVCQGMASGESLEDLVSEDGKDARPTWEEFARHSMDQRFARQVAEAESHRIKRFQERLVKALNSVFKDATQENIDVLKNTGQALERMLKSGNTQNVVLQVKRTFPDSWWDADFNEDVIERDKGKLDNDGSDLVTKEENNENR